MLHNLGRRASSEPLPYPPRRARSRRERPASSRPPVRAAPWPGGCDSAGFGVHDKRRAMDEGAGVLQAQQPLGLLVGGRARRAPVELDEPGALLEGIAPSRRPRRAVHRQHGPGAHERGQRAATARRRTQPFGGGAGGRAAPKPRTDIPDDHTQRFLGATPARFDRRTLFLAQNSSSQLGQILARRYWTYVQSLATLRPSSLRSFHDPACAFKARF
jgi:hypothetical protein